MTKISSFSDLIEINLKSKEIVLFQPPVELNTIDLDYDVNEKLIDDNDTIELVMSIELYEEFKAKIEQENDFAFDYRLDLLLA